MEQISTTCVIAGGGPAGMMLGYLLARAGVDVTVLEKHKDFLRDFRGDTVHPSTLAVMHELGLLERFLKLPHTKIRSGTVEIGDAHFTVGDFSRLPTLCKFIALMPQWDFLDFLAAEAKRFANFHLLMETEAKDLWPRHGRIVGHPRHRSQWPCPDSRRPHHRRRRAPFRVARQIGPARSSIWARRSMCCG